MKYLVILFVLCFSMNLFASASMTRVEPSLFIDKPQTNFETIAFGNPDLKKQLMQELFDLDLIDLFASHAFDVNAKFETFYQRYESNFYCLDLDRDSIPEIIFNGLFSPEDDRELIEVFYRQNGKLKSVYKDIGLLFAYKIQPNTQEVLLYHHQYPCCENASHNLFRLRFINGKLKLSKQYFLGRGSQMIGPFYPNKSTFTGKSVVAKKDIELRWSAAKVEKDAWLNRSQSNVIARYALGSVYTVLAKKEKWRFILMKAIPVADKNNRVINPDNFNDTFVFGWIKID